MRNTERPKIDRPGWLKVRHRRTLSGDGSTRRESTVECPFEGRAVALDDCRACGFLDGVSLDARERNSAILCARNLEESENDPEPPPAPGRIGADPYAFADLRAPISELMNRNVLSVRSDLSIDALPAIFLEEGISGVPVVDDAGRPIGMVSKTDLLRPSSQCCAMVGEIMSPLVVALPGEASLARAAAVMAFEGIHRVPVVDMSGKVIGLLSAVDVMRWIARVAGYRVPDYTRAQKP